MLELILIVLFAMSISFICSILEAALLSLSNSDIARISEKNPKLARVWIRFKKYIGKPIAVILLVNTLAHTIGASLAGARFDNLYGGKYLAIFSIAYSFAMIQWTELLPKTLGTNNNIKVAYLSGYPLQFAAFLLTPIIALLNFINKPFEGKKEESGFDSISEISVLVHHAHRNRMISRGQVDIMDRTLALSQLRVSDIMLPRSDIKFMNTSMSLADALVEAHIHNHTRFPLIDPEKLNEVIGYVNFKDIVSALRMNPSNPTLKGIVRPIIRISATENLAGAMKTLTESYQHISVVTASDGSICGLLTLEDLVESIIGDLIDEYDILPEFIYPIAQNRYVVGGGVALAALADQHALNLGSREGNLNDLMERCCSTLRTDEKFALGEAAVIIRKVKRSKVFEAIIEKNPDAR